MISNSDELDIYWTNGVPKANNCLIVTKPEFGSAPWVAVSGVIGKREPVGGYRILATNILRPCSIHKFLDLFLSYC